MLCPKFPARREEVTERGGEPQLSPQEFLNQSNEVQRHMTTLTQSAAPSVEVVLSFLSPSENPA
jgi:hypothetical protein